MDNRQHYIEKLAAAQQTVDQLASKVKDHHWYLNYHVSPPAQWMNDPNGFSLFKGEAHLFYQHHPFSAEWGPMYWGHVKSADLVHWQHLPIALAPSEEYDRDGCFSGSAIEKNGKLYLMYTGHVLTGPDGDEDLIQTQALAVSDDGIDFAKLKENPVIVIPPEGDIHPGHFRDPKVWEHKGTYYCVIGSRTKTTRIGQVLLYRSNDLIHWDFVNIIAKGSDNFGFMWECPDLFRLCGKEVLVMSPQGMKPEGDLYHNIHQSGYVIGELDYETGVFSHGPFYLLDHGFDYYAPQTMVDGCGRRIIIAWMSMWEDQMPTKEYGWAGAMTIPRVVELNGGKLSIYPLPELEKLRLDEIRHENVVVSGKRALEGVFGDCIELKVTVSMKTAQKFAVKMRVNHSENEETVLSYDVASSRLTLDRTKSGAVEGGQRHAPVDLHNNQLHLHIFIDKSSIEIFVGDGDIVMTARVFPKEYSSGIAFFADKEVELVCVEKWDLKPSVKWKKMLR